MGATQIVAGVVSLVITAVAVVLIVRAVRQMFAVVRVGQPDTSRSSDRGVRTLNMLRETLGHTKMLTWGWVGAAHWFVMVGFILLSALVLQAYWEAFSPSSDLPWLGHWSVFGFVTEWLSVLGIAAILLLMAIRLAKRPNRRTRSRFLGSTMWQGYFVEWVVLIVLICGMLIRGFSAAGGYLPFPPWAAPVSRALGDVLPKADLAVVLIALVKIVISMTWAIVIALNITMGVAWHRFLAFPNIFFKRSGGSRPALGALRPMMSGGAPLDFEQADPEKDLFGVAHVEHFSWKGLLDFTTCTECGRCQSQCPAWNTGKPLSPKLLIMDLRDHLFAKAPYLIDGKPMPEEGSVELTGSDHG